jgi:hypothetical protein
MKEHLKCNTEICVLTSPKFLSFAKINDIARIIQENYKPQGPAETTEWLSNVEIDTILEQLVKKYSNRKCLHITYQTRDFQEIGSNMARLDFVEVFKKYNCFAVVFNTDYHTGSGIHWFCMFGELDTATGTITLEYFNSSGRPPLPEIQEWLIKTKNELIKADQWKKVEIVYVNNVEFQDDDHSCGVYTLSYIWLRLEGAKPKWFTKDLFNDALMLQMRKRLFRS